MNKLAIALAAVWIAGVSEASAASAQDGASPDARAIMGTAFERMFNYPSVRTVRLRIHRGGRSVTRRDFEVVYKRIGERGHTLLRFTAPEYLRNNALLMVERGNGRSDTWLYQDSEQRIRRVSTAQRADSFYGSDLTFEDLEHHDWSLFAVRRLGDEAEQGRDCYVVEAVPTRESQYSKVVVHIEKERLAVLRVDFYRGPSDLPIKSLIVAAEEIEEENGMLKPRRFLVTQHGRDAKTEVEFLHIEADPDITNEVFTSMQLERSGTNLYKLVERLGNDGEAPR